MDRLMAGSGTGYPIHFHCAKARRVYYGARAPRSNHPRDLDDWYDDIARTAEERSRHVVTLTGKTRPSTEGKGHPRKSRTTRQYKCSCGHIGWSSHIALERQEKGWEG
jgi:hypothetical protein